MIFVVSTGTEKCKRCGSSDLWRVFERSGVIARMMKFRGRKPFQCRACGWIFYRPARQSALRADRATVAAANILTLSDAVGCTTRQDDDVNESLSRPDQGQRHLRG
jgi:hypothetical protein